MLIQCDENRRPNRGPLARLDDVKTRYVEFAAMVVIDAVVRLVPGVLGDEESSKEDSFTGEGRLLEFAQYTRPREFRGLEVPEILLSGNHEAIARWRKQERLARTRERQAKQTETEKHRAANALVKPGPHGEAGGESTDRKDREP